jgi:peptidoglycan/xylan/chitin deacetylase (PgdA/CDA1 family)
MRTVSFCFDDGFARTAAKAQRIFGERGLAACFAVLAAPQLAADRAIREAEIADWGVWREALAAGHDVEPHGWDHAHLGRIPLGAATDSVARTLDCFQHELPRFEPRTALFHAPYLAAPPAVVGWIGARMLGVRIGGADDGLNVGADLVLGGPVQCATHGPNLIDDWLADRLERFLARPEGWLVLALHGLDDEGWGPVTSHTLSAALDRLLGASVAIEPPSRVMRRRLRAGDQRGADR